METFLGSKSNIQIHANFFRIQIQHPNPQNSFLESKSNIHKILHISRSNIHAQKQNPKRFLKDRKFENMCFASKKLLNLNLSYENGTELQINLRWTKNSSEKRYFSRNVSYFARLKNRHFRRMQNMNMVISRRNEPEGDFRKKLSFFSGGSR